MHKPADKILGKVGSKAHKGALDRLVQRRDFLLSQCADYWQSSVQFMNLWVSKREDLRLDASDQWMANVFVADPFKFSEMKAALMLKMMYSIDPPIQPEAVGDEDYEGSRAITRLLDYALRKNSFRKALSNAARMMSVKGMQWAALGWTDDVRKVEYEAEQGEVEEFQKRMTDVFQGMGITDPTQMPDWMTNPEAFEAWRQEAKTRGTDIPEPPLLH